MSRHPTNSIKVDRDKDPILYKILKRLEKDGECYYENGSDLTSALIKYGQRASPYIQIGLLLPVFKPVTRVPELRDAKMLKIPNGVKIIEVVEVNNKKISYFHITEGIT